MKALNNFIGFLLIFTVCSLFFLDEKNRTPELSLTIFVLMISLLVTTFLVKKTSSSCKQTEAE